MIDEEWRPCHPNPLYEVSNLGRVRNGRNGRVLTPQITGPPRSRYLGVYLGAQVPAKVHVLVCTAFHGPRPAGLVVAHYNGERFDNRAENLRWATRLENYEDSVRHGSAALPPRLQGVELGMAKLNDDAVREIRRLSRSGVGARPIAARFGVSRACVRHVIAGKTWTHVKDEAA